MGFETSRTVRLASVGDIPEGQGRGFHVGDIFVAIFQDRGHFYSIEDACPHAGAPLNDGPVRNGTVSCLWHGWCFSLQDGRCTNLPRGLPVPVFPLAVEGDEIYVTLPVSSSEASSDPS